MNIVKSVNIARLVTAYNLQIDSAMLPDNLKCVKCKLVLQDACQVLCGCRFCRACIDDLMASGSEYCPGLSEDCGESLLSGFVTDYSSNKSISRLAVKCPQSGCAHKCRLAEIEDHILGCQRVGMACPFREWGCPQDKLDAKEMNGHVQQENHRHFQILIGMIGDITREIEISKRSDEISKNEIKMLKHELVLTNGKITTIIDQMRHVENEIKSIKREKADLIDRVESLSEKIEREIDERRENDEPSNASVIEHIDKEITTITALIRSNKDELDTAIKLVRDENRSINQDSSKSNKCDLDCMKPQLESIQALVTAGLVDASCEWTIDADLEKTHWDWSLRDTDSITTGISKEYFTGTTRAYKYRLASANLIGSTDSHLYIYLRIYPGPSDSTLSWPFTGTLNIVVLDKTKREASGSITLQCTIGRPAKNHWSCSEKFEFSHSSLIKHGMDLNSGVHVSCVVVSTRKDR